MKRIKTIFLTCLFYILIVYSFLFTYSYITRDKTTVWDHFNDVSSLCFEVNNGVTVENYPIDMSWVKKCDFIEPDIQVEDYICKIVCLAETNDNVQHIMEIGKYSLAIDGKIYTLSSKREYEALLRGISYTLSMYGLTEKIDLMKGN